MKILAIDASPTRGVISLSVEEAAAAAEQAGAEVTRVRIADLKIRSCTGCGWCRYTDSCKITDDVPMLAEAIDIADGVIFGLASCFNHPDEITSTVLERLKCYFPDDRQLILRGVTRRDVPPAPAARAAKRAVIITACSAPEPLATFFGYTTGPIRELREALGTSMRTIGSLSLTGSWVRHSFDEWERDKASALGRMLAGRI